MLKDKLTIEQQSEILGELFGFRIEKDNLIIGKPENKFVIYNEIGYPFYGIKGNNQFDFSTLEGIFAYAAHRAKTQGYEDCQRDIRRTLGLKG